MQSRSKTTGANVPESDTIPPLQIAIQDWDGTERRDSDRRQQPTRPWTRWLGPLRRERGRRRADQVGYVDRYSRREVALILAVFLMNVADAFLTLLWLERGGEEANPIMDFFLDIGPGAFLIQKCLVVGIWLVILLVHKNFRFARLGLYASLVVYAVLMLIHFGILAFGAEPPATGEVPDSRAIPERRQTLHPDSTPPETLAAGGIARTPSTSESTDQERNDGLDAKDAGAETDRREADLGQSIDLVVEQPALGTDE